MARIKSVFLLANDIYLKQIRRMYYNEVFSNPDYKGLVIQNAIYDLSKVKFNENTKPGTLFPSPEMIALAEQARMMGTTLWFDSGDTAKMKETIIATGQFTTCYNLLKFLNKRDFHARPDKDLEALKQLLENDLKEFLKNLRRML